MNILLFILGYFACGIGYYLLLIYLEINEIIDEYSAFVVSDGTEAFWHIVFWPLSAVGLGICILMNKFDELHKKIYEKMKRRTKKK